MAKIFNVTYYLRTNYTNKDGLSSIMVRISDGHSRLSVGSTGYSVSKDMWDTTKQQCLTKSGYLRFINSQLQNIKAELVDAYHQHEHSPDYHIEKVKASYLGYENHPKQFLKYYERFLDKLREEVGKTISSASLQKYGVIKKHFADFIKKEYGRSDIAFPELNYEVIKGFYHYLVVHADHQNNTASRALKTLKTVVLNALKDGTLKQDPFRDVRIHMDPVDRGFLTDVEVALIIDADIEANTNIEFVRDVFLFACFTGLAYIDVANLTYDNIKDVDDRQWIVTSRQKTKVSSHIPLLSIPLQVIEKYRGKADGNKVFPMLSNQKMNDNLKKIARICNIQKDLTFHLARHTFATMLLSKGVPIESVSRMLGHTNIKTTQLYAKITSKKVEQDMDAVSDKLSKFNLKSQC